MIKTFLHRYFLVKQLCLLCLQCSYAAAVSAQPSSPLSLRQVVDSAEALYPATFTYADKIQALQSKADGATSLMPPQISVGLNRLPYQMNSMQEKESLASQAGLMISAEQMITHPAKLKLRRDLLIAQVHIERSKASWTKNEIRTQAKVYYYRRYIAERKILILRESEKVLRLVLQSASSSYLYNQADLNLVFKAEAKLAELSSMQLMLESEVAQNTIGMNTLMNKSPNNQFSIDSLLPVSIPLPLLAGTSVRQRSDILAMEHTIRSMEVNKQVMAAARKPDFSIRAEHMQMFGMPNQFSVMGMMTIPLAPWSSPMFKSDVKSMQFEILAMQKEKETMLLMAHQMLEDKRTMLRYESEQLNLYQSKILPSFRKSFEVNFINLQQGKGSLFVLLDSWEMLLMKQLECLDKQLSVRLLTAGIEYELEQN